MGASPCGAAGAKGRDREESGRGRHGPDAGSGHREHGFESVEPDRIPCLRHERKLTRNLTFKFANREYGIRGEGKGYRLQGKDVTLCEGWDGELTVLPGERELQARVLGEGRKPVPLEDSKTVNSAADRAADRQRKGPKRKPAANPPVEGHGAAGEGTGGSSPSRREGAQERRRRTARPPGTGRTF